MISELHGKCYYVVIGPEHPITRIAAERLYDYLYYVMPDEEFEIHGLMDGTDFDGNVVLLSLSKCGAFRGEKYIIWERVKRMAYKKKPGLIKIAEQDKQD